MKFKYVKMLIILISATAWLMAVPPEIKYPRYFSPDGLAKSQNGNPLFDRARGYADQGKLQSAILNYGSFIDWGDDNSPGGLWGNFQYIANVSFIMGVPGAPPGSPPAEPKTKLNKLPAGFSPYPWAVRPSPNPSDGGELVYWGATVSESWMDRTPNLVQIDWDAAVGSKGKIYSGEVTAGDIYGGIYTREDDTYPLLATSTIPESWPKAYDEETGDEYSVWPGWWAIDTDIASPTYGQEVPDRFVSDVDIYLEFDDAFAGRAIMNPDIGYPTGTKVYATVHSYGRSYAEDVIFITMKVVNESDKLGLNEGLGYDYEYAYFGFYFDVDAYSALANGSAIGRTNDDDMMGYNSELDYAYIYDLDDESGGYRNLAYTAIKLLDTPTASDTVDLGDGRIIHPGDKLGMTDWHWFDWYNRPGVAQKESNSVGYAGDGEFPESPYKEIIQYKLMAGDTSNLDYYSGDWKNWYFHPNPAGEVNPHFDSMSGLLQKHPNGLDCVLIMSSGPFNFAVGDTQMFSFAIIMGQDEEDLYRNAKMAQVMYDLKYQGFSPPQPPVVNAVSLWDSTLQKPYVRISWDDRAETSTDIVTKYQDFQGYKVYKSTDGGVTWGNPLYDQIYDLDGVPAGWKPIAQYDFTASQDIARYGREISGPDPLAPWKSLGKNTGLAHEYIDRNVEIGVEYTYSVTAYDIGMQRFAVKVAYDSLWSADLNQYVRYNFRNDTLYAQTNPDPLWGGYELESLENPKGNTVLAPNFVKIIPAKKPLNVTHSTIVKRIEGSRGTIPIEIRIADPSKVRKDQYEISIKASSQVGSFGPMIRAPQYTVVNLSRGDTLVVNDPNIDYEGGNPLTSYHAVFDGLQVLFQNIYKARLKEAYWNNSEMEENATYSVSTSQSYPTADDYAIVFGNPGSVLDSAYWNTPMPASMAAVSFKGVKLNTGETMDLLVRELSATRNGELDQKETIIFLEKGIPGVNPALRQPTWGVTFDWDTLAPYPFKAGDTLFLYTDKPLHDGDKFTFNSSELTDLQEISKDDMKKIRVVPNPYIVTAYWEQNQYRKRILFTNLPEECTITIFNLVGEKVNTLNHKNAFDDSEAWDLSTTNRQEVAPGLYVFAVETPQGKKHIGKFAIIR